MPSMLSLAGVALLLLGAATADAKTADTSRLAARAPAAAQTQDGSAPAPRASRRKPRILHLPSPSEESTAQRDRRLARECRGLPNAGACLGYALERPRGIRPPAGR